MNDSHTFAGSNGYEARTPFRASAELFLISVLILFLELACIRWFPAHVLFLTFFTNTVLLACFVGMSVGCLAAGHRRNYLVWTPVLLGLAMAAAQVVHAVRGGLSKNLDVGNQSSPQFVFFGTETYSGDPTRFPIPMEAVCGFFFLLIALTLVGPGQELGRALNRMPHRVQAYTINIFGSVVGIVLFAGCSYLHLPPLWWFIPVLVGLGYFLFPRRQFRWALLGGTPVAVVWLAAMTSGSYGAPNGLSSEHYWSPYYRIDFDPFLRAGDNAYPFKMITTNLIGHQKMGSKNSTYPPYALPHLFNRDAGRPGFKDVLIIGAGSGNDMSRALQWGAEHVDAVEIDPVIQRLGKEHHPDKPYQDARVNPVLNDGRNFLRTAPDHKYDLVVYALVDSLVLHSSYSNIRLESYLFTEQAFADVKRCLKPGGLFVMYNFFRQGWIVARLHKGLAATFESEPLVVVLPSRHEINPEDRADGFTIFIAGAADATQPIRTAFRDSPHYWLRTTAPSPDSPNGFSTPPENQRAGLLEVDEKQKEKAWHQFSLATVSQPDDELRLATDDWPFLYLREPMIPDLSWRGMAIMGALALALLFCFRPREKGQPGQLGLNVQMFFLGAGFMLIETKAVVHMALLFGSTWMVNSVVFFAILVMILAANLFVLKFKPAKLWPYYTGLALALLVNSQVTLDAFLGLSPVVRVVGSCLLVFAPILFAAVIFAVSFARSTTPDRAFGFNIAGAMLGGLAENTSMLVGFRYLVLVALAFYALSAVGLRVPVFARKEPAPEPAVPVG